MKNLYILFLILSACASQSVGERSISSLSFLLPCKTEEQRVGAPRYAVVKEAKRVNGVWKNQFFLKVIPQNPTAEARVLKFKPAGSGDEDYNEYNLVDGKGTGVSGAAIHNQFRWASLVSETGSSFARCEKE